MRIRDYISLVLLLALTGCSALPKLPFAAPAQLSPCPGLTVGVLIGAEGDPIAEEQRDGYEMALEQANADGGPSGCKLSLVYLPEVVSGSPNQVYKAVRTLVEEEKVVAILGGTSSTASMFAASLVNRFSVPMLIPGAGGAHVLPENNHWTFRVGASDEMYSRAVFAMIDQELGPNKNVALVFENTTAGHDAAVTAATVAQEFEMSLLQYGALDASQAGYEAVYERLLENPPDVLYLILGQPNQALELMRVFTAEGGEMPMTIVQGSGFVNRVFLEQAKSELAPVTAELIAVSSWMGEEPTGAGDGFIEDFTRFTTQKYGSPRKPTTHSAMAYNSLRILQSAVRYGSTAWSGGTVADMAAAREALRADLQAYRENTPAWGSISFTTGGQNQAGVYLQKITQAPTTLNLPGETDRRASLP